MILITFDESSDDSDAGACCGEVDGLGFDDPSHPNMDEVGLYGAGGGRVGALVLSRFVTPGTVSNHAYNHYSQLRTVEDIFGSGIWATRSSRRSTRSERTSTPGPAAERGRAPGWQR